MSCYCLQKTSGKRLCPEEMLLRTLLGESRFLFFFTAVTFQMFRLSFSKTEISNFFSFFSYSWESLWDNLFSTLAKFSEKLTFFTPWCAYVRVHIREKDFFWKSLQS